MDNHSRHYDKKLLPPTQNQNASLLNIQPDNHLAHHKATSTIPSYRFHNSHLPVSNPRSFHSSIPSPNPASPLPAIQNLFSFTKTPPFFGFVLICRISEKTNASPKGLLFFFLPFFASLFYILQKNKPGHFP